VAAGELLLVAAFTRGARVRLRLRGEAPDRALWRRLIAIGAPAGGEFLTMAVLLAAVQAILAQRGASAQAGFGVGVRVMQAVFLPAMAVSFAMAPVAGQNVGAGLVERVRETFRVGVIGACAVMAAVTALVHLAPERMVGAFSADPAAVVVGAEYLRIVSWNFVANGIVFACGGMFQALGNTLPSLLASSLRVLLFLAAAAALARQPGFPLGQLWVLSVASVFLQMVLALALLRREGARRLPGLAAAARAAAGSAA
jgi:Na+-driven multidrug efflux pump